MQNLHYWEKGSKLSERYIALLRGINVGRANRVAMADLRALVAGLGYTDVRTLLNSGNVLFDGPVADTTELSLRIEQALHAHLHVSTQVILLTAADLAVVVDENPLLGIASDPSRLMVSFPRGPVDPRPLQPLLEQDWSPEALALGQRATYLWCPAGLIESRLAQAVARAHGEAPTTLRNWSTVMKLYALVNAGHD